MKRRELFRMLSGALAAAMLMSSSVCAAETEAGDAAAEEAVLALTEEAADIPIGEEIPDGDWGDESAESEEESLSLEFGEAKVTELSVTLDGEELSVIEYESRYCLYPNSDEQYISIYVPEGADPESPIFFLVNNSGWQSNSYSQRTQISEGDEYVSDDDEDYVGAALARNYVVVSYGARSRSDEAVDGVYLGHTAATIVDTKAAIRYLRYLSVTGDLPAGDVDRIIVNGTSGGGALTTIIASSGNSADYFEELCAIGALGINVDENGEYYSAEGLGDEVWTAIAYCPINDLGNADAAYEFTYNDTRYYMVANRGSSWQGTDGDVTAEVLAASDELAAYYAEFVDSLGLTLEDGVTPLTSDNLEEAIIALLNEEIAATYEEEGLDYMLADLAGEDGAENANYTRSYNSTSDNWIDFLSYDEDGVPYIADQEAFENYLICVASNQELKPAPAFSNAGLEYRANNEDSLFGSSAYEYSAFNEYSWNNDKVEGNGCGLDDTGLTWDEYLETEEGQELQAQLDKSTAITYLLDDENGESAAHFYVRHGMMDRDTSFATQTVLYYALLADESIEDVNFGFVWLKQHMGNYDVQEAFAYIDDCLEADAE